MTRVNSKRHLLTWSAVLVITVTIAACGDPGDTLVSRAPDRDSGGAVLQTDELLARGFAVSNGMPAAAALGPDLVIINGIWNDGIVHLKDGTPNKDGTAAVRWQWDGTATELPAPPATRGQMVVGTGDTVTMVGISCLDTECLEAKLIAARLSKDEKSWDKFDLGIPASGDTSMDVIGSGSRYGVVWTSSGTIAIDARGTYRILPNGEDKSSNSFYSNCLVGDTLMRLVVTTINVDSTGGLDDVSAYEIAALQTLDLNDPESEWRSAEPPPRGFTGTGSGFLSCTQDGVLAISGSRELVFDSNGWRVNPVALPGSLLVPNSMVVTGLGSAVAPDGDVYVVNMANKALAVRSTDGNWRDTGISADGVISVADGVVAFNSVTNRITLVRQDRG